MPKERKKSGSRSITEHIYILCEGAKDKSESAYFKAFIRSPGCFMIRIVTTSMLKLLQLHKQRI